MKAKELNKKIGELIKYTGRAPQNKTKIMGDTKNNMKINNSTIF